MADPLTWSRHHRSYLARCGQDGQGVVTVIPFCQMDGNAQWAWCVDMLPADLEPCIFGTATTAADAKVAAERQVTNWPQLIEGARRHG